MKMVQIDSPYTDYPGHIEVPAMLSPRQFSNWYTAVQKMEEDQDDLRHGFMKSLEARLPIINIQIKKVEKVTTAEDLPYMQMVTWMVESTSFLFEEALRLKKLPS